MMGLPDLSGVIEATKDMPEQFEALVTRLDRVVELLEQQNRLLEDDNITSRYDFEGET